MTEAIEGQSSPGLGALEQVLSARELLAVWQPRLVAMLAAWHAGLPPEARTGWMRGAAYLRESDPASLVKDALEGQFQRLLAMMALRRIYIEEDAVFFDLQSGTDIGPRVAFQRLFERALAGGFRAVGVYVNERMFRNLEQASQIKRQFRMKGIELVYMGMYEGDRRNPAAWQLETMQDASAEMHARNTSFYVGMQFEVITRNGRPVGRIPEVYQEKVRAPSFLGRRGSVLEWSVVEPLGSIMQEGCRRYLAGESMADLARWSATTGLSGVTPKGHVMDKRWWYSALTNPKFAGYQMPTTYMGFRPGVESPKRPRRGPDSELVPCMLPALWTLDDYHSILRTSRKRWSGPKVRRSYQPYLLSGIAYDAACGHRMKVEQTGPEGRYWMCCKDIGLDGRHSVSRRCDVAARELDEILGGIRLDDDGLHRQVESELLALAAKQVAELDRFRPNPAIAAARLALASLREAGLGDIGKELQQRIAALEADDAERRETLNEPLVDFRRALEQIEDWRKVWSDADLRTKNQLLREADVRVTIGRLDEERDRQPAHILTISSGNPVFELALAAALESQSMTKGSQQTLQRPYVEIRPHVDLGLSTMVRDVLIEGSVRVPLPHFDLPRWANNRPPDLEGGPWYSTAQFGALVGLSGGRVRELVARGTIRARRVPHNGGFWRMIHADEAERVIARPRPGSIAARRPDLVPEWDDHGNGDLRPDALKSSYGLRVSWRCLADPTHPPYRMAPVTRLRKFVACPSCAEGSSCRAA